MYLVAVPTTLFRLPIIVGRISKTLWVSCGATVKLQALLVSADVNLCLKL